MPHRKAIDPQRVRPVGPIRIAIAGLLLAFGALLASISYSCTALGRRWITDTTFVSLSRAIRSFQRKSLRGKPMSAWERRLIGIGPSLIVSIFGALTVLWTLLLIGGALSWLVIHGYGPFVLLGTVILGAGIGSKRASIKQQMPQHEQLN